MLVVVSVLMAFKLWCIQAIYIYIYDELGFLFWMLLDCFRGLWR
jgi:hypothetical protein